MPRRSPGRPTTTKHARRPGVVLNAHAAEAGTVPGRTSVRSGVSPSTSTSRSPTRAPRSAVAAATTRTSTRSTSLPSSRTTAGAPEVLTSTRTRCDPATTSSVRIGTMAGSSATGVTVTSWTDRGESKSSRSHCSSGSPASELTHEVSMSPSIAAAGPAWTSTGP